MEMAGLSVQAKVYRCLLDIASGLAFLHQKSILHGDLKLGNILLKSTASDLRGERRAWSTCALCHHVPA
jgi:serine/threonine protein kinase